MKLSKLIVFVSIFLLCKTLHAQTQLLKDYDFDKGGYYLIGMRSESDHNSLADSLKEFYTNDVKVLNAIKKAWIFTKPSPKYACGYHYRIAICRNRSKLESFYINLNCNEIATDKGYFYFDVQKLRMFYHNLIKLKRKEKEFSSITEARSFMETVLKDSSIIYTETPQWAKYEGYFMFSYASPKKNKSLLGKEKEILDILKNELADAYPGEEFQLDDSGVSGTEIFVRAYCNKSLFDKFTLYKHDNKWEPYSLYLTYWTK